SPRAIAFDESAIKEKLSNTEAPCYAVRDFRGRIGFTNEGAISSEGQGLEVVAYAPAFTADQLGDASFRKDYNLKYAYKTGAMANGIASEALVIAMGKAGLLGSFGAAGLVPKRVMQAIDTIQAALPTQSYAFNLIHSPNEEALERGAVELYLQHGVHVVEASAYLRLTKHIARYRVAGLSQDAEGNVQIQNRVIAKISRKETAKQFMEPCPDKLLQTLLSEGHITEAQAQLAKQVPMADDITMEADSGGHTDNRALVVSLPTIVSLRDQIMQQYNYATPIRVGAAGGISTPESALAAFTMGAAYVVTGSVNQGCVEAGTSEHVRKLLAGVSVTDVMMAPASDMFEMGVELQVLRRGTLFGPRAKKLYELYSRYKSIEEIPTEEIEKLEQKVFKKSLEDIWQGCIEFFTERDPHQIERAKNNPHRKMALIFRWYLGLSSSWANAGTEGRKSDYQIWCGPAMGAFNEWAKGSHLEAYENRNAAEVAEYIMQGAAYCYRIQTLRAQGAEVPQSCKHYVIEKEKALA
ncbi:MAG: PfaD family polyunsaturated fatty acid/polyketide biosynthesis protein, partial [Bacteroidota bacterium]